MTSDTTDKSSSQLPQGETIKAQRSASKGARIEAIPSSAVGLTDIEIWDAEGSAMLLTRLLADFRSFKGETTTALNDIKVTMSLIENDIKNVPTAKEFGELKGQVSSLPDKKFIISVTLVIVGGALTLFGLALHFFGLIAPQPPP